MQVYNQICSLRSFQLKELDKLLNYGGYTPLIANSNNEFEIFFNNSIKN